MELELVHVRLTVCGEHGDKHIDITALVLQRSGLSDIACQVGYNLFYKYLFNFIDVKHMVVLGRVSFHQEDAYALGFKVGDIL